MVTEIELCESPNRTPFLFLFMGLDVERNLQIEGGYTSRIARSHFGWCCLYKEI